MDPARKTSPQEVKWNLAPDSHIANRVEPAAGAGEDSNGCKGDERQARREGGAASTANRRQVPRLRASPVGVCLPPAFGIAPVRVWLGVNVHPPCPIVKTLRGITASCHPEERRVSANLKAVRGNPDSSLALRKTRGLHCSLSSTLAILDCHRSGRSGIPDSRHRPRATVLATLMARPGAAPGVATLVTGVFACRVWPPMPEKFRHPAKPQARRQVFGLPGRANG